MQQKVRVFFTGFDSRVTDVTVISAGQTVTRSLSVWPRRTTRLTLDAFTVSRPCRDSIVADRHERTTVRAEYEDRDRDLRVWRYRRRQYGEFLKYLRHDGRLRGSRRAHGQRARFRRVLHVRFHRRLSDGQRCFRFAVLRSFEFEQVSINNAARIEVTKEPTPDFPRMR